MIDNNLKENLNNIALKVFEIANLKGDINQALRELHTVSGLYMIFDILELIDLPKRKELIHKLNTSKDKMSAIKEIINELNLEKIQKAYKLSFVRAIEDHIDGDYVETIPKEVSDKIDVLLDPLKN